MKTKLNLLFVIRHSSFAMLAAITLFSASPRAPAQTIWGSALSFDGTNDWVQAGDVPLANSSFTVEAWVQRRSSDTVDMVVSQGGGSYNHCLMFGFHYYAGNQFIFDFYGNDVESGTADTDSGWHHWAGTYDASSKLRCLYRDGVLIASNTNTAEDYQGTGPLKIGVGPSGEAPNEFDGQIDDVRIWNVALSQAQIAAQMIHPLSGNEPNLLAYWKFDEGSGTDAFDATTNHFDATLVNGPTWVVSTVPIPFNYMTNNETITITGYTGPGGAVTIPATINGLPVTSIGDYAFFNLSSLTSITIPDGVTTIEFGAFAICTSLTNVTIPNSVISIGDEAFHSCTGLTSVVIGNGVTDIGWWAFSNCRSLTNVVLGNNVAIIGYRAFYQCTNLANITIPASVMFVAEQAFQGCSNLRGIYFQGNAPNLGGQEAFDAAGGRTTAYCLAGTTGWDTFYEHTLLSPAVLWNAQAQTGDGNFGVRMNRFGFTITGTANIPVVVDACTDLACAAWTPLQTCCVTNGSIYFCDEQWTNHPARFYRVRWP